MGYDGAAVCDEPSLDEPEVAAEPAWVAPFVKQAEELEVVYEQSHLYASAFRGIEDVMDGGVLKHDDVALLRIDEHATPLPDEGDGAAAVAQRSRQAPRCWA